MIGRDDVAEIVSRETLERLDVYVDVLQRWNPKINIVAQSTIPDVWARHIKDSLQLLDIVRPSGRWVDLGSGGGFPGLVLAVSGQSIADFSVALVESDQRKAAFLRTVLREVGANASTAKVIVDRVENIEPRAADVITARALAPLDQLLGYAVRHCAPGGVCLFHKGKNWKNELEDAERRWLFRYDVLPSSTNADSVILKVGEIARV